MSETTPPLFQEVEATETVQAAHHWPDATPNRRYLAHPHVHDFRVTVWAGVDQENRQIEFHDLRSRLRAILYFLAESDAEEAGAANTYRDRSCEQLAREVLEKMPEVHRVRVAEDEYSAATVERPTSLSGHRRSTVRGIPAPTIIAVDSGFASEYEAYRERPQIVTLCGSTKFAKEFKAAEAEYEMDGVMVFTVGFFAHAEKVEITEEQKVALDELHKWKISISDFVFVVNPGGYIGSSTRSEIEFARSRGIPVHFLEDEE